MFHRRELLAGLSTLGAMMWARAVWPSTAKIQFGYAAITWEGNDRQAIDDIASVGYRGIQLRSNVLAEFGSQPAALRDLLATRGLTFVALSSGNLRLDPALERDELDTHTKHAKFLKEAGGLYLQIIDERPKGRPSEASDYRRLGRLLTELGKRTADLGIPVSYHHHMNSLGERPEEVRAVLDAADPRVVRLQLDTAHYQQAGGDPVEAVNIYRDWLLFLHIKDLESPALAEATAGKPLPGATRDLSRSYRFLELGRGKVDLKGVFATLNDIDFNGWAIVELDRVTDPHRTPKESALISKGYIEQQLRLTI